MGVGVGVGVVRKADEATFEADVAVAEPNII